MRLSFERPTGERGQALVFVMILVAVSLIVLASLMGRTATNSLLNDRSNRYLAAGAAAEAATEKGLASLTYDYTRGGPAYVNNRLGTYPTLAPRPQEHAQWASYQFEDLSGTLGQLSVSQTSPWTPGAPLISQYEGLRGFASTFRVAAVARETGRDTPAAARVEQTVQLATIPIFQFAIFYNLDLEINPGPNMTVSGRVHSNHDIYAQPVSTLTFEEAVTAASQIIHDKKDGDPSRRSIGTIVYDDEHDAGVRSLNLPIGVDNTPENVRQIIEVPPPTEQTTSPLGGQRFYNNADLVVVVQDGGTPGAPPAIQVTGRQAFGMAGETVSQFMSFTNAAFYNAREGRTVKAIDVDVAGLQLHAPGVNSLYVDDQRAQTGSTQAGVRLVNGQTLPSGGFTVATRLPLYVLGHYNCPAGALGTHDTSGTQPAALIGDAVTILSSAWNDANSAAGLSSRVAQNTTVNAAILAGIVETSDDNGYSGGVENFPRFLESWSGRKLTYNGSMVVMYPSAVATGLWHYGGNFYTAPTRDWAFDTNFLDPTKLPPLTPQAVTGIRGAWVMGAAPTSDI